MAEPTKINWRSHRFLLLDLDDQFRFWARTLFYRLGVGDVLSTADGFDALHMVDRTPPTMVLVDLVLGGMSAADFVQRLRKKPGRMRHIPILLLAKSPDKPAIYAASLAGVEGIVVKPISEQALIGRVAKTLAAPERLVLNESFVGTDRRQADRAPTAGLPPPPSSVGSAPAAAETAAAAPRAVAAPTGPRAAYRPRPVIGGGAIDMDGAPEKPKVRDWGDDDGIAPPPKAPERIEVAAPKKPAAPEPVEVAAKKPVAPAPAKAEAKPAPKIPEPPAPRAAPVSTPDDWKEALSPERKEKMREEGPPAIDVPKLLEEHLTWLQSRGQRGFKARLEGADLSGMDLSNVNLSSANLKGINLSDSDCRGAVLEAADMRRGKLSGANLAGADLSHAQLRHVDLSMADLTAAKLIAADLAGANFSRSKLVGTDFTRASLLGADLSNADFKDVVGLTQLQLNKAYGDKTTKLPAGLRVVSPEDWSDTQ